MKRKNFTSFLEKDYKPAKPEDALFHIVQAPYEDNISYGRGTAKGPSAIIEASQYLEIFGGDREPANMGIYTATALKCEGRQEDVIEEISAAISKALKFDSIPVLFGGEHTVSIGMAKALFKKYGDEFGVIQFDSHCDLRPHYYGNRFSHACVMRRIREDFGSAIMQIGTRAYCEEEDKYRKKEKIRHISAAKIAEKGVPKRILPKKFPHKVFITFDVDALDPSIMPSTGTPEPGGLLWNDTMKILKLIAREAEIIAFDVVELAPIKGLHHSDYSAAKLAYSIMQLATPDKMRGRKK